MGRCRAANGVLGIEGDALNRAPVLIVTDEGLSVLGDRDMQAGRIASAAYLDSAPSFRSRVKRSLAAMPLAGPGLHLMHQLVNEKRRRLGHEADAGKEAGGCRLPGRFLALIEAIQVEADQLFAQSIQSGEHGARGLASPLDHPRTSRPPAAEDFVEFRCSLGSRRFRRNAFADQRNYWLGD